MFNYDESPWIVENPSDCMMETLLIYSGLVWSNLKKKSKKLLHSLLKILFLMAQIEKTFARKTSKYNHHGRTSATRGEIKKNC